MLYFIATPIGNLEDITFRAVSILKTCDYVLCEDTRKSQILFDRYDIQTLRKSYHRFNEAAKLSAIIEDLKMGKTIAIISDAGTPIFADPGARLINECQKQKIPYSSIPGPSSIINAHLLSGFDLPFQFLGFVPKEKKTLHTLLTQMSLYEGTSILFVPPSEIEKVLKTIEKDFSQNEIAIVREMTKIYEEVLIGKASFLLTKLPLKGEMVLLMKGFSKMPSNLPTHEMVLLFQTLFSMSEKDAIYATAKIKGIKKQEIYKKL